MDFVIEGYCIPYTRMTRRGKFVNSRALRYLESQERVAWQYRKQMVGREMLTGPLSVRILACVPKSKHHRSDIDNIGKGLVDAAQGIVFKNDLWIDELYIKRVQSKDGEFRYFVSINQLQQGE